MTDEQIERTAEGYMLAHAMGTVGDEWVGTDIINAFKAGWRVAIASAQPVAWMTPGYPQIITDEYKRENIDKYAWIKDYTTPLYAAPPQPTAPINAAAQEPPTAVDDQPPRETPEGPVAAAPQSTAAQPVETPRERFDLWWNNMAPKAGCITPAGHAWNGFVAGYQWRDRTTPPKSTADTAAPSTPQPAPAETALQQFNENECIVEERDPIERLRYFCSLAMSGQDWLDVEPFFDALVSTADTVRVPLGGMSQPFHTVLGPSQCRVCGLYPGQTCSRVPCQFAAKDTTP